MCARPGHAAIAFAPVVVVDCHAAAAAAAAISIVIIIEFTKTIFVCIVSSSSSNDSNTDNYNIIDSKQIAIDRTIDNDNYTDEHCIDNDIRFAKLVNK